MGSVSRLKYHADEIADRESKEGYRFQFSDDSWRIAKNHTINWRLLNSKVDADVEKGLRFTIARMAEEVSPYHTSNCFGYVRKYFFDESHYTGGKITAVQLINCKSALGRDDEYKLGTIRALLRNWGDWGYPGLADDVGDALDRLTLRGNFKGRSVLHSCPHTGPWTITEQQMLLNWAGNAFNEGTLSLQEFAWFLACYQTARRPSQLINLSPDFS